MRLPEPETARPADWLAQELREHQIELEIQNEELRRAQTELAAARDRYIDLYEFAPVGYLSLDQEGRILETNLTGAALLGQERARLTGSRLARFVADNDTDLWNHYLQRAFACDAPQRIELRLLGAEPGELWYGQIDSRCVAGPLHKATLRLTLTDITGRVQADMDRRIAALDADEQETQRQRVAWRLHEDLGQRLSALKMDLVHLPRIKDAEAFKARVDNLLSSLDGAVSTVRHITTDLRPPMLDDLGLAAAIEWLADDTARRLGLRYTLALDAEVLAPGNGHSLALYRFVQAALSLLLHDSGGRDFHIGLRRVADQVHLSLGAYCQRGAASTPAQIDTEAANVLEHRARLLGGRLHIASAPDRVGWVSLQLSLSAQALSQAVGPARESL